MTLLKFMSKLFVAVHLHIFHFLLPFRNAGDLPAHGLCHGKSNGSCPVCGCVGTLELDFLGNEAWCKKRQKS